MRIIFPLLILLGLPWHAFGQELRSDSINVLHEAEKAAEMGIREKVDPQKSISAFRLAAEKYETLLSQGIENPSLYFNLGNAYYLSDQIGPAIWAWRNGLLLSPGDEKMSVNLEFARKAVRTNMAPSEDSSSSAWLAAEVIYLVPGLFGMGYILYCLGWIRWAMSRIYFRGRWPILAILLVGAGLTLIGSALGLNILQKKVNQEPFVVVIAKKTDLRRGNGHTYPLAMGNADLSQGTEAKLLFEDKNWLQIELSGGSMGWVERSTVRIGGL